MGLGMEGSPWKMDGLLYSNQKEFVTNRREKKQKRGGKCHPFKDFRRLFNQPLG
jgi:hypothetical protein